MIYVTDLIAYFNPHFKYLNAANERRGFQLFSNSELTSELVALAKDLKVQIQGLVDDENMPGPTKADKFIETIACAHFNACHYRTMHASQRNGHPYKPSKFEKELLSGLQGILSEFPSVLNTFGMDFPLKGVRHDDPRLSDNLRVYLKLKEDCETLVDQIKTTRQPEITQSPIKNP